MPDDVKNIIHTPYTDKPAQGIMDGKTFLDSIQDDREIWYRGEKITNVTTHPYFSGMAHSLADIYDMQHDKKHQDVMTYVENNGLRVSTSYLRPTEKEHLAQRHKNTRFWSEQVHGMCGRLPDFCAAMTVGYVDLHDELAKLNPDLAKNAINYYEYARDNDLSCPMPCTIPAWINL